jgi:hypothetical protein
MFYASKPVSRKVSHSPAPRQDLQDSQDSIHPETPVHPVKETGRAFPVTTFQQQIHLDLKPPELTIHATQSTFRC